MEGLFDFNKDGQVSKSEKAMGYFGLIAIALMFIWGRMKGKESFAAGAKAGKAQARRMMSKSRRYGRRAYSYARRRFNYRKK